MASSPEYDKEPKAPDKSATTVSSEDSKLLHNSIHDQQSNSDLKSTHNTDNAEAENNKDVEALDDKSLQALLEEAIAYKGPKDREGKSSLFKELLEEAEQDDQACEAAAARSLGGCRGCSLQDLVAALAAEPAAGPRRHNARRHAPAPSNVSTRATQGGSLPSGVDTSSLLSEEPARGAGYLATVRCVNPPPLAERRVSASDANAPHDLELLNRRSKPTYPMTYTARATLEIGSGSVCSGRAVTTTTASNQVRTPHHSLTRPVRPPPAPADHHQAKLMNGLRPRAPRDSRLDDGGGGQHGHASRVLTPEVSEYVADQEKLFQALENSKDNCFDVIKTRDQKGFEELLDTEADPSGTLGDNDYFEMKEFTEMKSLFESIEILDVKKNLIKDSKGNRCDKDNDNSIELLDAHNNAVKDAKGCRSDKDKEYQMDHVIVKDMENMQIDDKDVQDVEADRLDIEKGQMEKNDIQTNLKTNNDDQAEASDHCIANNKDCGVSLNSNTVRTEKNLDNLNVTQDVDDKLTKLSENKTSDDRYVLAELPNNAYVFLTLPKRLLTLTNCDDVMRVKELEANNNINPYMPGNTAVAKPAKNKKEKAVVPKNSDMRKEAFNKNALKVLLFESQLRGDRMISIKSRLSPITDEVDSAIPFSCITTPEVVASCNTTSSASQSAVAVDAKPLQLGSSYRAVASLTGAAPAPRAAGPHPPHPPHPPQPSPEHALQPRSVIPSSFNGLPLSRPNYGSTATTAPDEYKKSLDENGNSVQGFSSPLAGSAQHKKPRRKKSSKNETVIDCRQIDGYQGDKDVNELLRFIESNAEGARAPKLGRAKHRDDADDKAGKKRSTERRKDKDKVKRATSLEEVSRTKLEDLTAGPRRADPPHHSHHSHHPHHPPAGKPERRSWGDTREPDHDDPTTELTDFQTVTKKRKQRRQAPSPPGPRQAPPSAPPSERSNDSNDDLDSAHSPPPAAPPAQPHASYADIARTRHNIPDLIESCNFYAEGEGEARRAADVCCRRPPTRTATPRWRCARRRRGAAETGAMPSRRRPACAATVRERAPGAEPLEPRAADGPAPDVVADRRPPVILLDVAARPGDMDGVTFGFDINEQLLSGPARRPRCDLVRDALEGGAGGGVAVRAGCAALRYVPPDPPADTHHLHQIIDYVGNAWEDVVRCGGGKVRYFSE
ncbi:LOW QUALITY PROTEIN: uncharacterized protein LOC115450946 [Manduca sexta]|uniref:LOW QUALITY PROTEIN: uncharacterized protein LOC115450946 n=1 Tax=Manduca sexta TaxID=7130 RepID=UPI00188DC833|nr:LOW QUALITY PROTEIN: uncharacterized protein LOC115450946 [Manduca sexta]